MVVRPAIGSTRIFSGVRIMAKKTAATGSLGERILAMRKKRKLDIEKLAKDTGYSTDFIRSVEEGEIAPPVGALIRIARALAVDSAALLADDSKKERRRSYRKRTKAYSYQTLTPGAEDNHLWAYMITLEPKKAHDNVEFKHEGEEFVYVLEGRVELTVGERVNVLKKGGSLHFNSGVGHRLRNLSTKKSKLIVVVYAP
jgi:quercetin dioxygenase-like cupin family protein